MNNALNRYLLAFGLIVISGCTPRAPSVPPALNTQTHLTPDPKPDPKDMGAPFAASITDPAMAGLNELPVARIKLSDGYYCTGILVGLQVVATAAHCFWDSKNVQSDPVEVNILSKAGKWVNAPITGAYLRANNHDWEYMDLALVHLKGSFDKTLNQPIIIGKRNASETEELKPETEVFSYGYTSRKWVKRETIETNAALYGPDKAKEIRKWVIPTRHAPAFGGDSGGPLVVKDPAIGEWILLGVLQGKKGILYSNERAITFTWVDPFSNEIYDFDNDKASDKVNFANIPATLMHQP
jgi:hypothetical protein